jgi:hypothetical protein
MNILSRHGIYSVDRGSCKNMCMSVDLFSSYEKIVYLMFYLIMERLSLIKKWKYNLKFWISEIYGFFGAFRWCRCISLNSHFIFSMLQVRTYYFSGLLLFVLWQYLIFDTGITFVGIWTSTWYESGHRFKWRSTSWICPKRPFISWRDWFLFMWISPVENNMFCI